MKIAHMKLRKVVDTLYGYRLGIDSAREPAPGKALSPGGATTTAVEEVRNTQGNDRRIDLRRKITARDGVTRRQSRRLATVNINAVASVKTGEGWYWVSSPNTKGVNDVD